MGFQDFVDTYIFPPTPDNEERPSFEGSDFRVDPKKGKARMVQPDEEEIEAPPLLSKKVAKELQPFHTTIAKLANSFGEDDGHMIMPGTKEFHEAIGTSAKANGLDPTLYNLPVIGGIMASFSPDMQSLRAKQEGADKLYGALLQAKMGHVAEQFGAPKTLNEAQTMFPGMIQPNPEQTIMAPTGPGSSMAPTPDPSAPLTPAQLSLISGMTKGLGAGHLTRTPEGVVPTALAVSEGKRVDPQLQRQYWDTLEQAQILPTGGAANIGNTIQGPVPASFLTSLGTQVTHGATANQGNKLSQNVRDVLAARGLPATPENVAAARELIQSETIDMEKQKQRLKSGSDQQLAVALRRFNKFPHELSEQESKIVQKEVLQNAADLAAYEKAATITTLNETQPLNESAIYWLDKKGHPASPDDTRAKAAKDGRIAVSPAQLEGVNTAKAAKVMLGQYQDVIKKVLVKATGNTAIDLAKVNVNRLKAWVRGNAGDPDVQALDALNSNIALYSRALGDTGNIAVAEQLMRLAGLPNWSSTQESSKTKLRSLEMSLDAVIKGRGIPIDTAANTYYKPEEEAAAAKAKEDSKKSLSKAESRYNELKKSGMKDADIYRKLIEEGH